MIDLVVIDEGLEGFGVELVKETERDVLPLVAQAAERLVTRIRQKLSVRGGPSRPGDPPALEEGALRDSIGRTGPFTESGKVSAAVGVGVGKEAEAAVNRWKAQDVNVFEYGDVQERGGLAGVDGTTRLPPRPYVRPAFAELAPSIVADWEAAL